MKDLKNGDIASPSNQKIHVTERFILQALRSTGYSVYTAIPELIDNSIDAEAKKIKITYDSQERTFIIEDNGNGMSFDKLKESMDIGCDREYNDTEIGYFGVGMKSACLNLVDFDIVDHFVEIRSFDGNQATRVLWSPINNPLDYDIFSEAPSTEKGTTIKIYGVSKFQESKLKKDLGVFYYPILNCNDLDITVNDNKIFSNDPLYRNSDATKKNSFKATVKGQDIDIQACAMDANQVKHSWDDGKNSGFTMDKSGVYVIYGGRYIEYGGSLGLRVQHNQDNRTRIEFSVPKDLTTTFNVKFNKTKGLNIADDDCLADLRQKLRDAYIWAMDTRKGESEISDEDKNKLDNMTKNINKSAKKARFQKPKKEVPTVPPVAPPTPPVVEPEVEKPQLKPHIRVDKIFDFKYEALDNISVFWKFNWLNGVFVITINEGHLFYKDIFSTMDDEKKEQLLRFLASLAYAQYESLKKEDISELSVEIFWEQYWSDVSTKLRYLLEY